MELAKENGFSMSKIQVIPVILCGGSGTRLWPLSRASHPKQFLALSGTKTLFQQALDRLIALNKTGVEIRQPLVLASEEHRFLVLDQLRDYHDIKPEILLEPAPRNTAPAMTFAALQALQNEDDPVLVVTPADQIVMNIDKFTSVVSSAIELASYGHIVTLGILPTKPETGYGYIQIKDGIGNCGESEVAQFVEKPDLATAETYLDDGHYLWNSGIFVVKASVWIKALSKFRPDILEATEYATREKLVDWTIYKTFAR